MDKCPDSPTGRHTFEPDEEYVAGTSAAAPVNCIYCGEDAPSTLQPVDSEELLAALQGLLTDALNGKIRNTLSVRKLASVRAASRVLKKAGR